MHPMNLNRTLAADAATRAARDAAALRDYLRPDRRNPERADVLRALLATAEGKSLRNVAPALHAETERIAAERRYTPAVADRILLEFGARDLTVANAPGGGYLGAGVAVAPGDVFADGLRAGVPFPVQEVAMRGPDATVPKITTDATAAWLSNEGATVTESTATYGSAAMSPKTVAVYMEASRQWLLQTTPAAQEFVLRSLGAVVGAAVAKAIIQGTGAAGQPLGLLSATGIGSRSGASLSWATTLATMGDVEAANGVRTPSAAGWALAADAAQVVRGKERATGSGYIMDDDRIAARPAVVSNAMPSGTAIFGDWSQILLGTWGTVELGADPYGVNSALFTKGLVGLRALVSVDVAVLQGASFSKLTSIS